MENEKMTRKKFNRLLKRIRTKPKEGLAEFYEIFAPQIRIEIACQCQDDDLFNEIENDVYLKVWKTAVKGGFIYKPKSWISRIVRTTVYDSVKQKLSQVAIACDFSKEETASVDVISKVEDEDAFLYSIACLRQEEKQIIIMRIVWDYTLEQVAKELKKPYGTVTSQYYRALDKIKKNKEKEKTDE